MLNLYKILALGMIVTKARIYFQLVLPVLGSHIVDVRAAWIRWTRAFSQSAHTNRAASFGNTPGDRHPEDGIISSILGGKMEVVSLLKPEENTGQVRLL